MGKRGRKRIRLAESTTTTSGATSAWFVESAVPMLERADLRGDLVTIDETSAAGTGTVPIRIITPGWGTSGYYPAEVLERDGPTAWPAGTHMYWDHPLASESVERPERSLRDLAGTLATGARWDPDHPDGPGLYAEATVLAPYRPSLAEMAAHIGVSVRAGGEAHQGLAEGRRGRIIDRIVEGYSVDFVTRAGRGGQVLTILEAARHGRPLASEAGLYTDDLRDRLRTALVDRFGDGQDRWCYVRDFNDSTVVFETYGDAVDNPGTFQLAYTLDGDTVTLDAGEPTEVKVTTTYTPVTSSTPTPMNESQEDPMPLTPEVKAEIAEAVKAAVGSATPPATIVEAEPAKPAEIEEARTRAERAETALMLRDARDHASAKVTEAAATLPDAVKARIVESVAANPAATDDGKVDRAKLDEAITAAIADEVKYLTEAGVTLGQVKGLGDTGGTAGGQPLDEAARTAELESIFGRLGMPETAAKSAAAGRR